MKLIFILLAALCSHNLGAQHLRFNEVMTGNNFVPADDQKAYPWVELVNSSSERIDLADFYISSDSSDLTEWALPSNQLSADSIFVLWLSGNGGSTHSDFELAADLSYLLLTDGSSILDYVPLGSMVYNQSYGRRKGFSDEWVYFIRMDNITAGKPNADPGPWVKVQDRAAFTKGDAGYFGAVVFDDKMWILDYETLEDDGSSWINLVEVWNSSDGYNWKLINKTPPYDHGAMITVFKDYIWAFDGRAFRSADGINWEQVSSNTPASEKVAVFNDCLWILQTKSIFRSCDGINWEKVVDQVPWYDRTWPAFMEHDGKLWMFGGNTNYNSFFDLYYTDVWSSDDGINWDLKNYRAPWRGTFWFSYASFDGKIWMIDGGWNFWDRHNNFNGNGSEVWYSEDGVVWTKSSAPTNWFNRHAHFTWVFKDELWIGAGYAGGGPHHLFNDIWKYSRKTAPELPQTDIYAAYGANIPLSIPPELPTQVNYTLLDPSIAFLRNDTLTATKPGETRMVFRQEGDDFYKSAEKEVKIVVTKKDLLVKPVDSESNFAQPVPEFQLEYSGFVFGEGKDVLDEVPAVTGIPTQFSPTGTYWLMASGGVDDNYNYVYEKGQFVIKPSADATLFFPNPVTNDLQIVSSGVIEGRVVIELYDGSGSLVYQHTQNNFQSKQFDLSSLRSGMYVVKVTSSTGNTVRKIVKF